MAGPRYRASDLLLIRKSPLVVKPEGLPSIEQWLEQSQELGGRKPRTQSGRADEPSPMGNFSTTSAQRPSLLQSRQISRTTSGDDIVLGPPKTSFASSRSTSKHVRNDDKLAIADDNDQAIEDESSQSRANGSSRGGFGAPASRDKDAWGVVRNSRPARDGRPSFGENDRGSRRNKFDHLVEGDGDAPARPQRTDQRWARDGDRPAGRLHGQERGGWRDRERDKRFDNDQSRSGFAERDPEWMDEPIENQDENQAHTAAEFERWKEGMKAGKSQPGGKEKENSPFASRSSDTVAAATGPKTGLDGMSFGDWGKEKPLETEQNKSTPGPPKAKASRFASLFNPTKGDNQQSAILDGLVASNNHEDQEGFQRMMQMLRGNSLSDQDTQPLPRGGDSLMQSHSTVADLALNGKPSSRAPSAVSNDRVNGSRQASRTPAAPDAAPRSAGLNKDTEFLLNLIQAKGPSDHVQDLAVPPGMMVKTAPPLGMFDQHQPQQSVSRNGGLGHGVADRLNPTQQPRPPPGFFDDANMPPQMRQHQHQHQQQLPPAFLPPAGHSMGGDHAFPSQQGTFDGHPPSMLGMPQLMRFPPPNMHGNVPGGGPRPMPAPGNFVGGMLPPPPPGFYGGPIHHAPGAPPGFGSQPQQHLLGGMGPTAGLGMMQQPLPDNMMRNPMNGQRGPLPPPGIFGDGGGRA